MQFSSKLSPDVLEVVRDVAKQEDSFLLRAQSVDLARLADDRQPVLRSSAPFLSPAEKHLLDCYRDEVAYAVETALFLRLTSASPMADAVVNPPNLPAYSSRLNHSRLLLSQGMQDFGAPLGLVHREAHALLGERECVAEVAWQSLARVALSIRQSVSALGNCALGAAHQGETLDALRFVERCRHLGPVAEVHLASNSGLALYSSRSFRPASDHYATAWRASGSTRHLACALWCSALARQESSMSTLWAAADDVLESKSTILWLRKAYRASKPLPMMHHSASQRPQNSNRLIELVTQ